MSDPAAGSEPRRNAPAPSLRAWLDHLAARDRLAVIRPGVALRFALAAIAKRLDGVKATLFPAPDGHTMPVVSGLMASRDWIADAVGVANGCNPNGAANRASLATDLAFYRAQGLITGDATVDQLVDHSFVEAALAKLGPYKP